VGHRMSELRELKERREGMSEVSGMWAIIEVDPHIKLIFFDVYSIKNKPNLF
jgi:hypothetical protein